MVLDKENKQKGLSPEELEDRLSLTDLWGGESTPTLDLDENEVIVTPRPKAPVEGSPQDD